MKVRCVTLRSGRGSRVVIFGAGGNKGNLLVDGKRGALPAGLPAKVWEEFRADAAVVALTETDLRRQWEVAKEHEPAQLAAYQCLTPFFVEAKFALVGVQLGPTVRVHAVSAAADATIAARLEKAAEAARQLGLKAVREEQAAAAKGQTKARQRDKVRMPSSKPFSTACVSLAAEPWSSWKASSPPRRSARCFRRYPLPTKLRRRLGARWHGPRDKATPMST